MPSGWRCSPDRFNLFARPSTWRVGWTQPICYPLLIQSPGSQSGHFQASFASKTSINPTCLPLHLPQLMIRIKPLIVFSIRMFLLLFTLAAIAALVVCLSIVPSLPLDESLKSIKLMSPLRIYSADNQLLLDIGELILRPVIEMAGV